MPASGSMNHGVLLGRYAVPSTGVLATEPPTPAT
jgi:hypothetical protein